MTELQSEPAAERPANWPRLPVIIVAGFLGAGKTTLLNHLLAGGSARVGVIVNDFGSVNIDALAVAGQVDSMISIGNGCLCCAVDTEGVDEMLGRLTDPELDLDLIVVEASGLAEPSDMIRLILSSTNSHIEYGGLVEVVDAAEFESSSQKHPSLLEQLGVADLVVLNKADRVDEEHLAAVRATVADATGGAPVVVTDHGRIPPELLFEHRERPRATEVPGQLSFADLEHEHDNDGAEGHEHHLHAAYDAVTFVSDQPLDPRAFVRFLEDRPAGLFRIKGDLRFDVVGHTDRFTLHTVGWYARVERSAWGADKPRTQLVLIGTDLEQDKLTAQLGDCAAPAAGSLDENAMMGILRLIQD